MKIEEYDGTHSLAEILFIDLQAVEDFYDLVKDNYSQDELKNINKCFMQTGGNFFIACLENEIIGICGYTPVDKETVELRRLRISKSHRSQGYGSKLLTHIERDIRSKGFLTVQFETAAIRASTIEFYKSHAYSSIGHGKYANLATILFRKSLS